MFLKINFQLKLLAFLLIIQGKCFSENFATNFEIEDGAINHLLLELRGEEVSESIPYIGDAKIRINNLQINFIDNKFAFEIDLGFYFKEKFISSFKNEIQFYEHELTASLDEIKNQLLLRVKDATFGYSTAFNDSFDSFWVNVKSKNIIDVNEIDEIEPYVKSLVYSNVFKIPVYQLRSTNSTESKILDVLKYKKSFYHEELNLSIINYGMFFSLNNSLLIRFFANYEIPKPDIWYEFDGITLTIKSNRKFDVFHGSIKGFGNYPPKELRVNNIEKIDDYYEGSLNLTDLSWAYWSWIWKKHNNLSIAHDNNKGHQWGDDFGRSMELYLFPSIQTEKEKPYYLSYKVQGYFRFNL